MAIHRRFTARNCLLALVLVLLVLLVLHPNAAQFWDRGQNVGSYYDADLRAGGSGKERGSGEGAIGSSKVSGDKGKKGTRRKTAVVVASQASEDATWLDEYFPQWDKNIYRVDDLSATLTVPKNKGRESMVYLTYIIDNYDDLPDNILFIHPNRFQWHNDDPDYDGLPMLRHFQISYLEQQGYVNIRCAWALGCPAEIKPLAEEGEHRENVHAGGDYKQAFQILFPGKEVPREVGVSCCAQFAATREKIKERGREDYVRWRKWLLETELDDNISGRVMEYSWHIIFGKPPVHCPSAAECYCKVFGACNLECNQNGSCEGRYILPPYSTLPQGWPFIGWKGEERNRSAPED